MTLQSIVSMSLGLVGLAALATACAVEPSEQTASDEQGIHQKICPKIAVWCIDGYTPKATGGCNYVCVPDHGDNWECSNDIDCPAIYCITTPCPQNQCRGHRCVMDTGSPAQTCGKAACGAGSYCCDSYCGTCAPDGYACIQGCASSSL